MSKQIPWLRIFVEGVVIVASILLAFGLQAWWDGVQERADERALIVDLSVEFSENLSDLRATIERHRRYAVLIDGLGSMTSDLRSLLTEWLGELDDAHEQSQRLLGAGEAGSIQDGGARRSVGQSAALVG